MDLPWEEPLAGWDTARLVRMAHGVSRHVVRFVAYEDRVYAVKETEPAAAEREYRMLRRLRIENLPAVEPVGVVTGRCRSGGEPLPAALITRYLDYSLPFHYLFGREGSPRLNAKLIDAAVVLLVRLHLEGFYWGDCSLSNLLFRRDAGALMAYLVDAETAEHTPGLADRRRIADLEVAQENLIGGLSDLVAAGRLDPATDVVAVAEELGARYRALWDELTGPEEVDADDRQAIERRIRRLNDIGFDVEELDVAFTADGNRLVLRPALVEEGHHARELRRLTGLEVQENQARRLLNDISAYGAYLASATGRSLAPAVAAARWIADVYEPITAQIPAELRGRLEPAEFFHELLEHRYLRSEREGRSVPNPEAVASYLATVLPERPEERLLAVHDDA
ncbi:MAG: DUF4032 domain-containing protein [Actinobacteria bacterium]|nr:DUF4032 domain-containing protein [Actinomycetota bacterium]